MSRHECRLMIAGGNSGYGTANTMFRAWYGGRKGNDGTPPEPMISSRGCNGDRVVIVPEELKKLYRQRAVLMAEPFATRLSGACQSS
jgi:hypothetical protein